MQGATIACDFADLALIKARLANRGVAVTGETFTETGAVLTIDMRKDVVDDVLALVTDLSRGKAIVSLEN
jgi:putative IMPACT (imprinted ancient) family translation regulator